MPPRIPEPRANPPVLGGGTRSGRKTSVVFVTLFYILRLSVAIPSLKSSSPVFAPLTPVLPCAILSFMLAPTPESPNAYAEVVPSVPSSGEVVATVEDSRPPVRLDPLEDMFCLAVIEYGGNLKEAYKSVFGQDVHQPNAKARALMCRPEIAGRILDLTTAVQDNALISLGSHLVELAEIRDLAKFSGQLKVALNAEESRGKAAGLYVGKGESSPVRGPADLVNPMVVINVGTPHDAGI